MFRAYLHVPDEQGEQNQTKSRDDNGKSDLSNIGAGSKILPQRTAQFAIFIRLESMQ